MTRWLALLGVLTGTVLLAEQKPNFRTEINYVELHVSVTDSRGQRVRGLTKADFDVRESGAPQIIEAVEEISLPMPAPSEPGQLEPDGSVADAGLTRQGRVYAIVIDRAGLDPGTAPKLRRQLAEFIDDFITPADLVAVINLGGSAATPFTSNKARLRAALGLQQLERGRVMSDLADLSQPGAGGRFESEAAEAAAEIAAGFAKAESARNATTTTSGFDAVADLAKFLRGFEGRRKAVVYVAAGADVMPGTASGFDPQQKVDQNAIANAYNRMISALVANNITVYSIDPRGLSTFNPFDGGGSQVAIPNFIGTRYAGGVEMLRGIADDTGGIAAVGFNDLTMPYQRIVEDNSHYYVIGYSSNRAADGKRHDVAVAVRGRDAEVRTRRQIEAASQKAKPGAFDAAWRKTDVASLLGRPVQTADPGLRLRVSAGAISWKADKAVAQLAVEIHENGLALREDNGGWVNDVIAGFQVVNDQGKVVAAKSETIKLRVRPSTNDAIRDYGWRYVTEFEIPAGVHQLRVAASETGSGKSGSAFLDLAIVDPRKQPVAVAGLALTSDAARLVPTAGASPTIQLAGRFVVTAARTFSSADTVTALASIVDNISGDHDAAISAALLAPDGQVAKQVSKTMAAGDLRAGAAPRVLAMELAGVPAGDYSLVVKIDAGGKSARRSVVIRVIK